MKELLQQRSRNHLYVLIILDEACLLLAVLTVVTLPGIFPKEFHDSLKDTKHNSSRWYCT